MTASRATCLLIITFVAVCHERVSAVEALVRRGGEVWVVDQGYYAEYVMMEGWSEGRETNIRIRILRRDLPERGLRAATEEQASALLSMAASFQYAREAIFTLTASPRLSFWGLAKDTTSRYPEAFLFHRGSWVCHYGP